MYFGVNMVKIIAQLVDPCSNLLYTACKIMLNIMDLKLFTK